MNKSYLFALILLILSTFLFVSSCIMDQLYGVASAITSPMRLALYHSEVMYIPSYKTVYPFLQAYIAEDFGDQALFSINSLTLNAGMDGQTNALSFCVRGHIIANGEASSQLFVVVSANGTVREWRGL